MKNGKNVLLITGVSAVFILLVIMILVMAGKNTGPDNEMNAVLQRISALEARLDKVAADINNLKQAMVNRDELEKFTTDYNKRNTDIIFRITDIEAKLGITPSSASTEEKKQAQPAPKKKTQKQAQDTDAKPAKQKPVTAQPAPEPEPNQSKAVKQVQMNAYYTVKKGDTAYSISRRFGMKVEQLLKINGLKSPTIYPGQKLKVTQ